MYPIEHFDALRLRIRDEGTVRNKAVHLALGARADGKKEVLSLWVEQAEDKCSNHHNDRSRKTVTTPEREALELTIPRDRQATPEPQLAVKYPRRLPGFDERVISMYAHSRSVRDYQPLAGNLRPWRYRRI